VTLPIAIAIVLLTIAVGSAAYIFVARRSPEGGRGKRTPTSVYAVTAGAMSLLILGSIIAIGSLVVYADRSKQAWGHILLIVAPLFIASAALVVIAFFDRPYADTPGSITPRALELTLERMTQNPIGDLPLPVCPPRA